MAQGGAQIIGDVNGKIRIETDTGRLLVSTGPIDIMLAGYDLSNNIVVKVAKPGFDVKTATDDQLIFNSAQNTFKIVGAPLTGNFPTTTVATNNQQKQTNLVTVIPHGITGGRIPGVIAYVRLSGTSYCLMPYTTIDQFGNTINNYAQRSYSVTADTTNVYVSLQVSQTTTTNASINYGGEPVKIYLTQETAN